MQEQSALAHTAVGSDTFVDVLRANVEALRDELALRFVIDPGGESASEDLSFGALDRRARRIAVELQACRGPC